MIKPVLAAISFALCAPHSVAETNLFKLLPLHDAPTAVQEDEILSAFSASGSALIDFAIGAKAVEAASGTSVAAQSKPDGALSLLPQKGHLDADGKAWLKVSGNVTIDPSKERFTVRANTPVTLQVSPALIASHPSFFVNAAIDLGKGGTLSAEYTADGGNRRSQAQATGLSILSVVLEPAGKSAYLTLSANVDWNLKNIEITPLERPARTAPVAVPKTVRPK